MKYVFMTIGSHILPVAFWIVL